MPDLSESWKCLRCGWAIDLPIEEADPDLYHELVGSIRRHRLNHIGISANADKRWGMSERTMQRLEGLLSASEEEVWSACFGDTYSTNNTKEWTVNPTATGPAADYFRAQQLLAGVVTMEDVAPILEGIDKLLRADFKDAQRRVKWLRG